jgi:DNA primase
LQPLSSSQRSTLESFLTYGLGEHARAYLERRGLLGVATDLRFGEVSARPNQGHERYAGRLIIPSFSARGTMTDLALRCIQGHDCGEVDCRKYLFLPGVTKRLYNVGAVTTVSPSIHICEGQLDAASLVACGLPAVGVAGAQAWPAHAHRLFQGFDSVYFWADRDDKGASMVLYERIRQSLSAASLIMVGEGLDVNSHYVAYGTKGILSLLEGEVDEVAPDAVAEQIPF